MSNYGISSVNANDIFPFQRRQTGEAEFRVGPDRHRFPSIFTAFAPSTSSLALDDEDRRFEIGAPHEPQTFPQSLGFRKPGFGHRFSYESPFAFLTHQLALPMSRQTRRHLWVGVDDFSRRTDKDDNTIQSYSSSSSNLIIFTDFTNIKDDEFCRHKI